MLNNLWEMKYNCNKIFMIRTPELPIEWLFDYMHQEKDIYEFIKSNKELDCFFRRALLISSPSLFESYIEKPQNEKKYAKMKESLFKFFLRSTTRTTPYGYFASVSLGELSRSTKLKKNITKNIIDLKVDGGWINSVVHTLENDKKVLEKIKLKYNSICFKSGDRVKNPYFTNHGEEKEKETYINENSIKYSPVIEIVKNSALKYIGYTELIKILAQYYPDVEQEMIGHTIVELIENEYLLSNLRIPAYCNDALEHVITQLKEIKYRGEYLSKLEEIEAKITEYKCTENIELIKEIYRQMSAISKKKNYLVLNCGKEFSYNTLSYDVIVEILKVVEMASKIPVEFDSVKKFKEKFLQYYGSNVEVPIEQIIDDNDFDGLKLFELNSIRETQNEQNISEYIQNKVVMGLINGKEEIEFQYNEFDKFEQKNQSIVDTLDLNFLISNCDEGYQIRLGANIGDDKAGAMMQRFSNCFNSELYEEYNEIYNKEKELCDNDYMLVEAREMFSFGRGNNILNDKRKYEYFIAIGCLSDDKGQIDIHDLVIGMSGNMELYVKSRRHNKKIKIVSDNMLNPEYNNPIIKMLKAISQTHQPSIEGRLAVLNQDDGMSYHPRIRFGRVIVAPKRWTFCKQDFDVTTCEMFYSELQKKRKGYKIDRYVYWGQYDQRIPIDLTNSFCIKMLYSDWRQGKKLHFYEIENAFGTSAIVCDQNNKRYFSEFVFSFYAIKNNIGQSIEMKEDIILRNENRRKSLCEEGWVYFKLYGVGVRSNEILGKELKELLEKIHNTKHFFIRYHDEMGAHLRIRIKFVSENIAWNHMPKIVKWIQNLMKKNMVSNYTFNIYDRETNRYGGIECVELCEKVFMKNSIIVESILNNLDVQDSEKIEKCYISGIARILKCLSNDIDDMLYLLDCSIEVRQHREDYRKKRRYYIELVEKEIKDEHFEKNIVEEKLALTELKNLINSNSEKLTNTREAIILSIVHMYCNRITGIRKYESKYCEMVRNAIYDIINQRRNKNNDIGIDK